MSNPTAPHSERVIGTPDGSAKPLPSAARRKVVLVVDDDPGARDALLQLLSDRYDVVTAMDGVDGFEMATLLDPDLIVTDVTMPRLDGVAMVKRIRARMQRKAPVIFLTGCDTPSDVIAGISAGARHYLSKPVDINDLERRIEHAIGV